MNTYKIVLFFFLILFSKVVSSQGGTCATAEPFCTGTTYTFPNSTNTTAEAGVNYGCLGSQPNPAWYYLQIANSGNISLNISQQREYRLQKYQ